jgi:hypothetical protein
VTSHSSLLNTLHAAEDFVLVIYDTVTRLAVPDVSACTLGTLKMQAIGHCCPCVAVLHPGRMEFSVVPL